MCFATPKDAFMNVARGNYDAWPQSGWVRNSDEKRKRDCTSCRDVVHVQFFFLHVAGSYCGGALVLRSCFWPQLNPSWALATHLLHSFLKFFVHMHIFVHSFYVERQTALFDVLVTANHLVALICIFPFQGSLEACT